MTDLSSEHTEWDIIRPAGMAGSKNSEDSSLGLALTLPFFFLFKEKLKEDRVDIFYSEE